MSVNNIFTKNLPSLDLHGETRDTARVLINDFIGDLNKVYLATSRACDYLSIITAFNEYSSDIIKLLIESK